MSYQGGLVLILPDMMSKRVRLEKMKKMKISEIKLNKDMGNNYTI